MSKQFLGTRYQSFKNDGTVNASGKVYFYEPGTSTAKTTYSDSALTVANANPVILNSAGAADIWYDGNADVSVYDSSDVLIDSYSSINPASSSSTVESNLIANGSFEEGGSTTPTGWTRSTPPALGSSAQDTDSSHGLYSWKFTSGGNGAGNLITTDYFNVAVGRTFNVVWQMKSSVADVRNLVEVVWYDDADVELSSSSLYDNSTTNPTSWTTKAALAIPVTNAVRAKLRITGCHSSDPTNGSTWFDGIQVTEAFISSTSLWMSEGASIASASDCDIWTTSGNTVHITGTTQIDDWGTAPRAGAWKRVIFDGVLTLNYNATTNDLPGDADVTTSANDSCIVYARSTSSYQIFDYTPSSGNIIARATGTAATYLGVATFSPTINVNVGDIVVVNLKFVGVMNAANAFLEEINVGESGAGTCALEFYPSQGCALMFGSHPSHASGSTVANSYSVTFKVITAGTLIAVGCTSVAESGTAPTVKTSYVTAEVRRSVS